MVQRGEQSRLSKQIAEIDVLPMRNLDGNFLVDPGVFGEVNRAESATAKWRQDFVLSDDLTTEKHCTQYTGHAKSRGVGRVGESEESGSRKSRRVWESKSRQ